MKKAKPIKAKIIKAMEALVTVNYQYKHNIDKKAYFEITDFVDVNHCPTCGAKLRKVKKG